MTVGLLVNRKLKYVAVFLAAMLFQFFVFALPAFSTERVTVSFGIFERTVSVASIETYARTGKLSRELKSFSRYFTPEQLDQVRSGLTISADVDVVTVSQFFYTPQGEAILRQLGGIVQTAGRQNGARAIRSALILAAADKDDEFNAISILNHFPTAGARVDLRQLSSVTQSVLTEINRTQQAVAQIQRQATTNQETDQETDQAAPAAFADLTAPGPHRWQMQSFNQLRLPTDLYLPEELPAGITSPLVVISHGLGGDRTNFAYVAKHLASYGFAVAVVEHPGSDANQINALFAGQTSQGIEPDEMIRRPTDIQALLDELAAVANHSTDSRLSDRVNLQQVGVLGQSLGAYTALALAGATVHLDTLAQACPPETSHFINLSLLVQCSILKLPQPLPPLSDRRIKAAIAINSIDSAVFGPAGMANITVPTMLISGSADTIAPALVEQIRPFTWLKSRDRYLLMMKHGTHFSTIDEPDDPNNLPGRRDAIPVPPQVIGPDVEAAKNYVKAMSVALFKTYLLGDNTYSPYLNQTYATALSQTDLPIYLLQDFTLKD